MKPDELIAEATSLPVEERARVADHILRTLNPPEADLDKEWAAVAQRRLTELRTGKAEAIPGQAVFATIQKRFGT